MEKALLFVMRASDMKRVHPDTDWSHVCERCHKKVGVYPSGQKVIASLGKANVELVCSRCDKPDRSGMLAPGAEFEPFESIQNPWKN